MNKKVGLIILDGWGIGDKSPSDAIFNASTPFMDYLWEQFPHATLTTFGEAVGLPEGQMGNSEVGHLNIGAGRIIYQELTRINKSIREGDFFQNPTLKAAMVKALEGKKKLHLMGLVSDGGVHSSQDHLHALLDMAHQYGLTEVYVHAFTDGRDCDPKSGANQVSKLQEHMQQSTGQIASIIGRYYAMDRDNRWERIKKAYDLLVNGIGETATNAKEVLLESYNQGITDEFIAPHVITKNGSPVALIEEEDVVISFNFRTDRPREITQALTQRAFPEYEMKPLKLAYYCMTNYDATFNNVAVVFEKDLLKNTLGEVLSMNGLNQVRIAETEKYPHVTFFFNGGREQPYEGEKRILIDSPKVATYDLQPEMSAPEVMNAMVNEINESAPDFFCLNFANPDMVGHTGVYSAIQKAVETVDHCLRELVQTAQRKGYELLIIADHGNADMATNKDGTPNTAHSMNPVPMILITREENMVLHNGILADVAPTILHRMGLNLPNEMTGKSVCV
jgi:2,3-bisphosphoglycerate-independent phosphoglycerate mutase